MLARVADGDRLAFERLYALYAPRLFAFVIRMVSDRERTEEVVNDVLFEVWRRAGTFRGEARVSTWIFGIAHHRALNALRVAGPRFVEDSNALEQLPDPKPGPGETLAARQYHARLVEAIRQLSPEHREVLELTLQHGFSCDEIAAIVGCPVGTVKTRMFHARGRLRTLLGAAGITAEAAL